MREQDAVSSAGAQPTAGQAMLLSGIDLHHVIVHRDVLQIDDSTIGPGIGLRCALDPVRIEADTVLPRR